MSGSNFSHRPCDDGSGPVEGHGGGDNLTTCLGTDWEDPEVAAPSPPSFSFSLLATGMGLYSLSALTFVGNAMVLHAIRTEKRLQTVSNMFIMSLALADLTVGCIVMPISSAYALTGDWHFGLFICQFWLSVDYTASTASIFNLFILSLDRYWSITSPLRYLRRRTKKRALLMIALAWTGASMWVVPVLGWHHIVRGGGRIVAADACETEFATNMTFKVVTAILNFYIPTSCMVFLYVRIFLAIRRRARDIDRLGAYTSNPSPKRSASRAHGSSTPCEPTFEISTSTAAGAVTPQLQQHVQRSPSGGDSSGSNTHHQQQLTPHVRRNQVVAAGGVGGVGGGGRGGGGRGGRHRQRKGNKIDGNDLLPPPPLLPQSLGKKSTSSGYEKMNGCAVGLGGDDCGSGDRGCSRGSGRRGRKSCEIHRRLTIIGLSKGHSQGEEEPVESAPASQQNHHRALVSSQNSNMSIGGGKLPLETLALFEDVRVRVEYVSSPMAQSKRGTQREYLPTAKVAGQKGGERLRRRRRDGNEIEVSAADGEEDNISLNSLGETQMESASSCGKPMQARNNNGVGRRNRRRIMKALNCEEEAPTLSRANCGAEKGICGSDSTETQSRRQSSPPPRSSHRRRLSPNPPPPPLAGRQPLSIGHKEAEAAAAGKKTSKMMKLLSSSASCVPQTPSADQSCDHSNHLHCYRSAKKLAPPSCSPSLVQPSILVSSPKQSGRSSPASLASCLDDVASSFNVVDDDAPTSTSVSIGTMTSSRRRRRKRADGEKELIKSGSERMLTRGTSGSALIRSFLRRTVSGSALEGGDNEGGRGAADGGGVRRASASVILAQEKKAATQLGVIVGAFILCWLPYFILFMAVAYCGSRSSGASSNNRGDGRAASNGEEGCVDQTLFTATVWFGYFNSALNPVLYPMCNANFKRAFKQMLGMDPDATTRRDKTVAVEGNKPGNAKHLAIRAKSVQKSQN